MDFVQDLIQNSSTPALTAFLLGLATALSPCPLATNITAIAYLGSDIDNRHRVFYSGLIYTLGRAITYTALGLIFFFGASMFKVAGFLNKYGERIIGPVLIIVGLLMLDVIKIKIGNKLNFSENIGKKAKSGNSLNILFMGLAFALAFCPYSGVLYFGMLIPLTVASTKGLYLPIVYAFGTGLPVITFAYFIAFTVGGIGNFYNRVKTFELWFRRVVATIFIGVGTYLLGIFLF